MEMIVCLFGDSGSGKTTIANEACLLDPRFSRIITSTTRMPRKDEYAGVDYFFHTRTNFQILESIDSFFGVTEYDGEKYGCQYKQLEDHEDKFRLVIVDSSGVIDYKNTYGSLSVYVSSPARHENLLLRGENSDERKEEKENSELADFTLINKGFIRDVALELIHLIGGDKNVSP